MIYKCSIHQAAFKKIKFDLSFIQAENKVGIGPVRTKSSLAQQLSFQTPQYQIL
jgi:hypothetical protein